jgi:glycerol-3-phosphate acyltransferase PlsY
MQIYYDPVTGLYLSGTIDTAEIANGAITDTQVATANKDGTAATPSMRTLGTGAAQACAGNDSRVTGAAAAAQPDWTAPSLLNSWVNLGGAYSVAGYFRDTLGMVHLRGVIAAGSVWTAVMFVLPVGYRPSYEAVFPVVSNNALGRLDIDTSGNVFMSGAGSTAWVSLDGISFRAA